MALDVIVDSDDLIVLGGPSSISVSVDNGPQGIRGSRIYGVLADPRLESTDKPEDLLPYDLAMVVSPDQPDYLSVYQKIGQSAIEWIKLASIAPNVFSAKATVTFASGIASSQIPVSQVFTVSDYDVSHFTVQLQIEGDYPISHSLSLSVIPANGEQYLNIVVNAIEFDGSSWSSISGDRTVHIFATAI